MNVSDSADGDECFSLSDRDTVVETVRWTHISWPTARAETSERKQGTIDIKGGKINAMLFSLVHQ